MPDELGVRLGDGRVEDALMARGPDREADLLSKDRLAGPRRARHHHDRTWLQATAEDQVKTANPGHYPRHCVPRPSLSRTSATLVRSSHLYGLAITASAPTARWGSPLAARLGMPAVAG